MTMGFWSEMDEAVDRLNEVMDFRQAKRDGALNLDPQDAEIVARRMLSLNATALDTPRVGDWVDFSDGVSRRIGYIWPDAAQTSDGGTYYLGNGHVSMSGSLHTGVPLHTLKFTGQRYGEVWIFHHDIHRAHNGVTTVRPFRVYACSLPSTETR